jgi:hypothetical protein
MGTADKVWKGRIPVTPHDAAGEHANVEQDMDAN